MRLILPMALLALFVAGCDDARVYEVNHDFEQRIWLANDKPEFEFEITNPVDRYSLYCNVRNSVAFPFSRLFIKYELKDSTGKVLDGKMFPAYLFDQHTGKPQGSSALGDIYDQRFPILSNYQFPSKGKYKVSFEQFMRKDTLEGVLAVGLRVEQGTTILEP
ncbi:MAG TPA: gliding motility lipoprotein GldH [Chryseosolibacter sp.]